MEFINPFTVYLTMIADNIVAGFAVALIVSLGAVCAYALASDESGIRVEVKENRILKRNKFAKYSVIFLLLGMLTPDTKTLAAMYIVPKIANNETLQTEANELYQIFREELRESLKEDDSE